MLQLFRFKGWTLSGGTCGLITQINTVLAAVAHHTLQKPNMPTLFKYPAKIVTISSEQLEWGNYRLTLKAKLKQIIVLLLSYIITARGIRQGCP